MMPAGCWRIRRQLTARGRDRADKFWDVVHRADKEWLEQELMNHIIVMLSREEQREAESGARAAGHH